MWNIIQFALNIITFLHNFLPDLSDEFLVSMILFVY